MIAARVECSSDLQFLDGIESVLPRLRQRRGPEGDDSAPGESLSRSRRVALSVPRTLGSKMAGCGFEEAAVAEGGGGRVAPHTAVICKQTRFSSCSCCSSCDAFRDVPGPRAVRAHRGHTGVSDLGLCVMASSAADSAPRVIPPRLNKTNPGWKCKRNMFTFRMFLK